jgi:hypothetical protein
MARSCARRACRHALFRNLKEDTLPSLDDWEKDWQEKAQRTVQTGVLAVDFWLSVATIMQSS